MAEQLLVLGSGCGLFRSFLLHHFLSEVGGVAEQLWEAQQVSVFLLSSRVPWVGGSRR